MRIAELCCRVALTALAALPSVPAWADSMEAQIADSGSAALVPPLPVPANHDAASPAAGFAPQPAACFDGVGMGLVPCGEGMGAVAAASLPVHWNLADLHSVSPSQEGGSESLAVEPAAPQEEGEYRLPDGVNGPADIKPRRVAGVPEDWADHVPREYATHRGFFKQLGTIKVESLLFLAYFSAQSGKKLFHPTVPFHFNSEPWFNEKSASVGVDKLGHAYNTYLIAEVLHSQLHHKTSASEGDALTAAILASALMAFNELSDGIEPDSGYSMEDILMNTAGAAFSLLRNTVPGLKEKVAFKLEIYPDKNIYSAQGKPHYAQQRFMLSLQGGGFKELEKTPLRFLDLQVGYYASDFLDEDREAGLKPKRHLFFGVGLNLGELLFKGSRSTLGKAAWSVLDYFQPPYTSLRYDTSSNSIVTSVKP